MTGKVVDFVDARIILRDAEEGAYRAENLICVNSDGSLRWTAALPQNTGTDCFVDVVLDGDNVRANTWSGWMIWFDCTTGIATKKSFAK